MKFYISNLDMGRGDRVKGIVLAGGLGTRLYPLTRITNKHLLPVYNKPMIYYPIEMLVRAGIKDIMIVTGGNNAGDFLRLLGSGKQFGLSHLDYTYQEKPGGIAEALSLCEHFIGGDKMIVALGDNILEQDIKPSVVSFVEEKPGARVFLVSVDNPKEYGIATIIDNGEIVSIEEKPASPKSNLAVIGLYMYSNDVFEIIRTLKPSGRGELEITDVNNFYLRQGRLTSETIKGFWLDAGESYNALMKASIIMYRMEE